METNTSAVQNFLDLLHQGTLPVKLTSEQINSYHWMTDDDGKDRLQYVKSLDDNLVYGVMQLTDENTIVFLTETYQLTFALSEIEDADSKTIHFVSVENNTFSARYSFAVL